MTDQLVRIKDYIIEKIRPVADLKLGIDAGTFLTALEAYLNELTDFGSIPEDKKACRQLLCSIGIDLKSGTIAPEHYFKIFSRMDFDNHQFNPRKLFNDVLLEQHLTFHADLKLTTEYCMMVFPVNDCMFYIDPKIAGISGSLQYERLISKVRNKIQKNEPVLKITELNKYSKLSFFWVSKRQGLQDILEKEEENPVSEIVDRLGLSHFNFNKPENKYFFCIDFGNMEVYTFKPNATMNNWSASSTGFLSGVAIHEGLTFCISGYASFADGLSERTFTSHRVDPSHLPSIRIEFLHRAIDTPFVISDDIVNEGITRFNQSYGI
jgi:hypothetical protein